MEWDANDEKHEEVESKEEAGTAEVKFNGTPLKGVLQKDKNGGMKMTVASLSSHRFLSFFQHLFFPTLLPLCRAVFVILAACMWQSG